MDREYFLWSFVIAATITAIAARTLVSKIDAWPLLEINDDPRERLIAVTAAVLLLWVAFSLISQIVSGAALAFSQWFLDVDSFFQRGRIRAVSINSGISSGIQVGLALGLLEYAARALTLIPTLWEAAAEVDPDVADGPAPTD